MLELPNEWANVYRGAVMSPTHFTLVGVGQSMLIKGSQLAETCKHKNILLNIVKNIAYLLILGSHFITNSAILFHNGAFESAVATHTRYNNNLRDHECVLHDKVCKCK